MLRPLRDLHSQCCACDAVFVLALFSAFVTRATLLHVLERPTALGPAEVRELEQLAQAFPYCQTAHLLLAKAAHDQGTMLAGQRLRRAATYAADRTLLRRLIEQEEPVAAPVPAVPPAPHPLDLVDWPDEYVPPTATPTVALVPSVATAAPAPIEALPLEALATLPPASTTETPVAAAAEASVAVPSLPELAARPELLSIPEPAPASTPLLALVEPIELLTTAPAAEPAEAPVAAPEAAGPTEAVAAETPEIAIPLPLAAPELAIPTPVADNTNAAMVETAPAPALAQPPAPVGEAILVATEATLLPAAVPPTVSAALESTTEAAPAPAAEEPEAELPPQAPAIRPPVEVGAARFEFGLAEPVPVPSSRAYELPGLVDEWAASAVTRGLGNPDALAPAFPVPAAPVFTPAAFTGDAVVGYAFGESSRLGLSMQLLDLLAAKAEAAESATAVVAAAQPPASALPPTGAFFEPDPLLLEHWTMHRPAAPELPSTIDLINNFLKRQPRLTRPAMLPPSATHQADLSVRSTRAEPDLVSENLARIFVRQGKTARAIEIYEKLMVKQPEKMAYFALQIQSLQPSA